MRIERQVAFWLAALLVTVLLLWLLSSVLMPFVAGMALAYLLNPVANRLQRMGINRLVACIVILGVAVVLFFVLLVAVVPLLVTQLSHLADNVPGYITRFQELARTLAAEQGDTLSKWLGIDIFEKLGLGEGKPTDVAGPLGNLVGKGMSWLSGLVGSIISGGSTLIGLASLLVITPVVAFYMLVDWERMMRTLDGLVPVEHRETVRRLAHEIDRAIGGFLRGQSLVCLFLGAWYGFGLLLIGLNFGFVIGLTGGLLSFIPFVGSLAVLVISSILAIVQGWPSLWLLVMVLAVVGTGQFLEGNVLTPRLVGASVGVHPVWLMFALLAFGSLFGFTGLLVAVPLAAAIGVLIRFGIERYRESALYRGTGA
ncbi:MULTISPECIES: AI-2E family transporter [unclassified Beijerinckia]|uniref:AI-2E family transporter n=1 Tax=unclassified Beijerinckia TaxID=2638183 RepID=UPI00089CF146|nr:MULTISPECIES: AI-2E family transporter [unclassified Beijerinckia]MDH7795681.1 putative PurR-regulated permease PerM [Beijerinckia sp. GAS462]SEC11636.1 Predicted PurR-regulated permease PerM [Beijerinckia sp. 28-YEA-48]